MLGGSPLLPRLGRDAQAGTRDACAPQNAANLFPRYRALASHAAALALLSFYILHSTFFISRVAAQQPLTPSASGTYYYLGYDSAQARHTYASASGTYYYVDLSGATTIGDAAPLPAPSPWRVTVSGTTTAIQFYNNNAGNYTLTTITAPDGAITTATDFSPREGTWFANNVTFTLPNGATADASGIWVEGVSAAFSATTAVTGSNIITYPNGTARVIYNDTPTFVGTDVNVFVDINNNTSRQAVSVRNGAAVYLFGGTISKTVTAAGAGSETIYMVGNQEGQGSAAHFHGEDLAIISSGSGLKTFNMANGNTTVELYRSTITTSIGGGPNTHVFYLNDQQDQGGAHFYGEDITINNAQGRAFAFGYGANSITLKNSTINSTGTAGAVFRWITSEGAGGGAGGNEAMADGFTSAVHLDNTNVTTTADYAPIFQQTGRWAAATVNGGAFTTTGAGSPILRLVGANDARDDTQFTGIFTNATLIAQNSSAIDLDMNPYDSANYGEDGGGVSKELTTNIKETWTLVFQSSTLAGATSFRIADACGSNPLTPYYNATLVTVYDSAILGQIQMTLTGTGDTTGAALVLQAARSRFTGGLLVTGTENARRSHTASLALADCVFDGDILATNRGDITLNLLNTPLNGAITMTGSTTAALTLDNSPLAGGIHLTGAARLRNNPGLDLNNNLSLIRNSPIAGGITLAGASTLDLTLSGPATTVTGGLSATDTATATLRLQDSATITGGLALSGSSTLNLVLSNANQLAGDLHINDRATLSLSTFNNTPIHLDRTLTLAGTWSIPSKVTLDGPLAITNPHATIRIAAATTDSLTLNSGLTGAGRLDIASIAGAALGLSEIRVINDKTNRFTAATPAPLVLSHPVDYGLAAYTLQNRPDGAWLVGGLDKGSLGAGGAAVFNTQALAAEDFFASLAPIDHRLDQLRQTNSDIFNGSTATPPARGDAGALWLQARADTTQVNRPGDSLDFTSRLMALTLGIDARWDADTAILTTGLFLDTARADRAFINAADGRATSAGTGLYISYHHRAGFHASLTGRFDSIENTLDTHDPNNALRATYSAQAGGLSLEAGWLFERPDGWWYNLSLQAALATLPSVTYTTASTRRENTFPITISAATASQELLRISLGKKLTRTWGFYARAAAANVHATGAHFTAPAAGLIAPADFTITGYRVEATAGLIRLIGRSGRLTFDATTVVAADYKRPFGLTLGYAHAW